MALRCSYEGCLFADQQICARTGNPTPCEFMGAVDSPAAEILEQLPTETVLQPVKNVVLDPQPRVHSGEELGLHDIGPLMEEQYSQLITILGDHGTGKTSFLVCLYLACACGQMDDYGLSFAGSLTLPGFEARARAGRKWSASGPPDRMTEHTVLGDDRSAGFLHLDLVRSTTRQRLRLLMSDLPGEWTKDLINNVRFSYRFPFIGRSDSILLMVDGEKLVGTLRHVEIDRLRTLIDRISELLMDRRPRIRIVATRADKIGIEPLAPLVELSQYASAQGFPCEARCICTFSQNQQTPCGTGVIELLESCLEPVVQPNVESAQSAHPRMFGSLPVMSGVNPS